MDRNEAIREARIAALYKGGKWFVTRREGTYKCLHEDSYRGTVDGKIVGTFTPTIVRATIPPPRVTVRLHYFVANQHEGCGHKHRSLLTALECFRRISKHGKSDGGVFHVYRASFNARGKFESFRAMTTQAERTALST